MKILVLGYYNRFNLGDEMFKETLPLLFPTSKCTFVCTDDFHGNINKYDAIVCGGGDIINDYFHKSISKIVVGYTGNIFAVGIGIPYPGLIKLGYLDIYDHVFIRERRDLLSLQRRLGSEYVHYLPDLGFLKYSSLKLAQNIPRKTKTIGIFLIQSIFKYSSIVDTLTQFLQTLSNKYNLIFYRFNSSNCSNEDDKFINEFISNKILSLQNKFLLSSRANIVNDMNIYTTDEMIEEMSKLDFGICMRFHSHIFSTVAGLPFMSIYYTRKVELYIKEEDYSKWACPIKMDEKSKPLSLNSNELLNTFERAIQDKEKIRKKLSFISKRYSFLLDTRQVENLIKQKRKRPRIESTFEYTNVEKIYSEIQNIFKRYFKCSIEESSSKKLSIPLSKANTLAEEICMKITRIPSSKYVYGTQQNIQKDPSKIYDMIKWIYDDFQKEYYFSAKRINLNYYCQDGFKGIHRSGWQYCIDYMQSMNCFNGVLCDTYLDRTFHWSQKIMSRKGYIPYTSTWIGFIHHTPNTQYTQYNCVQMFKNPLFLKSLLVCKGLLCLSQYLSKWVETQLQKLGYSDIPVISLYHPTQQVSKTFTMVKFMSNKSRKLINIGAWYRNPFTIYTLPEFDICQKAALKGKAMENYFPPSNIRISKNTLSSSIQCNKFEYYLKQYIVSNNYLLDKFNMTKENLPENFDFELYSNINQKTLYEQKLQNHLQHLLNSVQILEHFDNNEYDNLLSENIVFLHLIDCSAANTIIECIVRNTPIVVNRHPAIEEYLGKEYPLFYQNPEEIKYLINSTTIQKAYDYLRHKDKTFLSIDDFIHKFKTHPFYSTLTR